MLQCIVALTRVYHTLTYTQSLTIINPLNNKIKHHLLH